MRVASVGASLGVLGLTLVLVLGPAISAEAMSRPGVGCPDSSLCSPETAALLMEAGVVGSGPGTALASTVASGGTVMLGGFNGAVGILGAETVAGATGTSTSQVVTALILGGLVSLGGVGGQISLKTSTTVSPGDNPPPITPVMHTTHGDVQVYAVVNPFTGYDGYSYSGYCVKGAGSGYTSDFSVLYNGGTDRTPQIGNSGSQCTDATQVWIFAKFSTLGGADVHPPALGPALQSITVTSGADQGVTFPIGAGGVAVPGWYGTIRSTVTCAAPGTTTSVVATGAVSVPRGGKLPVPSAMCAPGFIATGTSIDFAPTTNPSGWVPLTNATIPGSVGGMITLYPDCFGPGVTPCALQLQRATGGSFISCGLLAVLCPSWVSESVASPASFRCMYGNYVLDLDHCSAFRVPGQLLPNADSTGAVVPRTAAPDAVPVTKLTDPVTGNQTVSPIVIGQSDASIECPLGGGDNFFTSVVPFFQSLPGWVKCMIVPQGWDRGGKLLAAGAPLALVMGGLASSLPTTLACGSVGDMPNIGGGSIPLNTCVLDVLPNPAKLVIGYVMVLGLAWLGVKRILWALGGDAAPRVAVSK